MLESLYSKDVLRKAASISRTERLENPDITLSHTAPLCGSRITVDLVVSTDGRISDYAQDIHACALGQAAASIVAEHIVGKSIAEMIAVVDQTRAMLLEGAAPPDGEWTDLGILAPVHDHEPRHGAVMLALETALDGLRQLMGEPLEAEDFLTRRS